LLLPNLPKKTPQLKNRRVLLKSDSPCYLAIQSARKLSVRDALVKSDHGELAANVFHLADGSERARFETQSPYSCYDYLQSIRDTVNETPKDECAEDTEVLA